MASMVLVVSYKHQPVEVPSMPASPLSLSDRLEIRVGVGLGETDGEIAEGLGRHRTTINREINRNGGRAAYCPEAAEARAGQKRSRPKIPKLVADAGLRREVARRVRLKDSPMRIAIELTASGRPISHETIYQSIYRRDRGLPAGLHQHLQLKRRHRKRRQGHRNPGSHSLGIFCSIHDRPQAALDRAEIGHLEGDLIVGAYNRSALITIFDRLSRRLWLEPVTAKTADAIYESLCRLFSYRLPPTQVLTLAWDQGAEIARHRELATRYGIDIYIADPKSPWQRPTNEAGNALVRRYVGKGIDLSIYTTAQLRHIEQRINTIPRRTLNWATAHDTYTQHVAMTG